MKSIKKQFSLKKPCADCPFRNDHQAINLRPGRREQIIKGLLSGDTAFHCHKTVYRSDDRNFDDNGNYVPNDICQCPGAIAVLKKLNREVPISEVAVALGVIEPDHYNQALSLTIEPSDLNL